jgi:hypothetical protein
VFRYKIYVTNEFTVQLRDSTFLTQLQRVNDSFGLRTRRNGFVDTKYHMEVPKQLCRNSLEMANYYSEEFLGWLQYASPNWLAEIRWFGKGSPPNQRLKLTD